MVIAMVAMVLVVPPLMMAVLTHCARRFDARVPYAVKLGAALDDLVEFTAVQPDSPALGAVVDFDAGAF